jgi:nucleotide-binding universal stress UspA family protein/glycosyltransferase involved in cell wall biosynthesis
MVGVVPIDDGISLSEGAIPARELRTKMRELAKECCVGHRQEKVIVSYHPWNDLADLVKHLHPDLLVIGLPEPLQALGVTTAEVLNYPPCDMALVRGPFPLAPARVLVPMRGGPHAELSLRTSLAISRTTHAAITSVNLAAKNTTDLQRSDPVEAAFRGLSRVLDAIPEIERQRISTEDPAATILDLSKAYDMVIMGATAQPVASRVSLGPVADRILRESPAGVIVVKTRRPMPAEMLSEAAGQYAISILVDKWFAENTFHADEFEDIKKLMELKEEQGLTISLALPSLNEEETVGKVISVVKKALMDDFPLLDEIILIDSNSNDRTRDIALELDVPVHIHQHTLPAYGERLGKGEALWKSLYITQGDIIVWIDTDITNIHPRFVYGLLGPMLINPQIQFIKGYYRRPIKVGNKIQAGGGGRVTELTARPLLNLFYPELSGVVQPLSGEYGGRRKALEQLPFFSGYGVEIGLLIDVFEKFGLRSIAQVDLQERIHRNQDLSALSKMSFAIIQAVIKKLERRYGSAILEDLNSTMKLIRQEEGQFYLDVVEIAERERPPMLEIVEYLAQIQPVKK